MTTTTTESPAKTEVEVPANILRDALTAALVAVETATYLPVLNAVQITQRPATSWCSAQPTATAWSG
jgi:hypothetical protein